MNVESTEMVAWREDMMRRTSVPSPLFLPEPHVCGPIVKDLYEVYFAVPRSDRSGVQPNLTIPGFRVVSVEDLGLDGDQHMWRFNVESV